MILSCLMSISLMCGNINCDYQVHAFHSEELYIKPVYILVYNPDDKKFNCYEIPAILSDFVNLENVCPFVESFDPIHLHAAQKIFPNMHLNKENYGF